LHPECEKDALDRLEKQRQGNVQGYQRQPVSQSISAKLTGALSKSATR
jgi:hypothetical protein